MKADQVEQARRFRFVCISPRILVDLLGGRINVKFNDIPSDVVIRNVTYVWERNAFAILLEHESFGPVNSGDLVPILECEISVVKIGEQA